MKYPPGKLIPVLSIICPELGGGGGGRGHSWPELRRGRVMKGVIDEWKFIQTHQYYYGLKALVNIVFS